MKLKIFCIIIIMAGLAGCMPETPVTSSITVEADIRIADVNPDLYGINIEEINHGVDGGIYAELIQNRSFEDGTAPINCAVDNYRQVFVTPNGYAMPFIRQDSIPGWKPTNKSSYIKVETMEPAREKSGKSLFVSAQKDEMSRGGVIAYGYEGIPLTKGEEYNLSFYLRNPYYYQKPMRAYLADSSGTGISAPFEFDPLAGWNRYRHTFTANKTTNNAQLRIEADSSMVFWIDVVSLFPKRTWNGRNNGQRPEVMEAIKDLKPAFVRFPGGAFAEGYTLGTFPRWHETIGPIADRKHFWGIWEYGTTNGTGFHEYIQMCEDLGAEPLYVINSGVTNQDRRPRYEDITMMNKLVDEALDAIGYANQPKDSVLGAMRARNGHEKPFNLKYIEIGSENYGTEYAKRFELFKEAIGKKYPDITVLRSSSDTKQKARHEWVDTHLNSGETYLLSSNDKYSTEKYSRRNPMATIGEFAFSSEDMNGSMRAAVAEAAFLVGAENNQDMVRRIAYSPIIGNIKFDIKKYPLILFDGQRMVFTPSYYAYRMLTNNRGTSMLRVETETYQRPQVTKGRVGIYMFDNAFSFRGAKINDKLISDIEVKSGEWSAEAGILTPVPNKWNYMLAGSPGEYNYTFSTEICRTKGSNLMEIRLRDNGASESARDYIGLTIGGGDMEIYRQSGTARDTLCAPLPLPVRNGEWFSLSVSLEDDVVSIFTDGKLMKKINLSPIPSLIVSASTDEERKEIILKVVNTTMHEEKTSINLKGVNVGSKAELITLEGEPKERNTYEHPDRITPAKSEHTFVIGTQRIYHFPPNSITIMKFKEN